MILLDGNKTSKVHYMSLKKEIENNNRRAPRLDIILFEGNFASEKYVALKKKKSEEIGIETVIHQFDSNTTEQELISEIEVLNKTEWVDGIMIQLPLPNFISRENILNALDPRKDVDGLTPTNIGKVFSGNKDRFLAATPKGIITLLNEYNIGLKCKDIILVGSSILVGIPLLGYLLSKEATVQVCHDKTLKLKKKCLNADVVISATGSPLLIKEDWIKEGAVVIDVGFGKDKGGELVGDVDFEKVKDKCSHITPVPGGVGPMTILSLLENTITAWRDNVK